MTKYRAAAALDRTHHLDNTGPRTYLARKRIAEWLDGVRKNGVKKYVLWLEHKVEIDGE